MIEKRLKEAEKMGFRRCIIPENNKKYLEENYKMEIVGVKDVREALKILNIKGQKKGWHKKRKEKRDRRATTKLNLSTNMRYMWKRQKHESLQEMRK